MIRQNRGGTAEARTARRTECSNQRSRSKRKSPRHIAERSLFSKREGTQGSTSTSHANSMRPECPAKRKRSNYGGAKRASANSGVPCRSMYAWSCAADVFQSLPFGPVRIAPSRPSRMRPLAVASETPRRKATSFGPRSGGCPDATYLRVFHVTSAWRGR